MPRCIGVYMSTLPRGNDRACAANALHGSLARSRARRDSAADDAAPRPASSTPDSAAARPTAPRREA
eukprot:CAMPEP_0196783690 /NCGR_PEP_ID=MMETSP1104-20130614/14668_1 /TAXON_ID=33652 /ORGANISM="Cafeteria sp., Strain Caron Lab Isolate" /LENGTH=66 /DNA_ID=CAMNT_0042153951 /DNA_START=97 /DNA_END=293 /DNA_ORIENTATION=+